MFVTKCGAIANDSKIKVAHKGRSAVFDNRERDAFKKICLDDLDSCVDKNREIADFLVEKEDFGALIVEFKGRDLNHALSQVDSTLQQIKEQGLNYKRLAALVVCEGHRPKLTQMKLNKLQIRCEIKSAIEYRGSFTKIFGK